MAGNIWFLNGFCLFLFVFAVIIFFVLCRTSSKKSPADQASLKIPKDGRRARQRSVDLYTGGHLFCCVQAVRKSRRCPVQWCLAWAPPLVMQPRRRCDLSAMFNVIVVSDRTCVRTRSSWVEPLKGAWAVRFQCLETYIIYRIILKAGYEETRILYLIRQGVHLPLGLDRCGVLSHALHLGDSWGPKNGHI